MPTTTATKPSLTIKRRFKASPDKVYAAWTQAETLARWMGSAHIVSGTATTDVRIGGRYHISMKTADDTHDVMGVYREVVPNRRLVFTWAWKSTPERESLVTVTFQPDGAGTLLTLLHEQFFDAAARDRHNNGWIGSMDKLETLLA